MQHRPVPLLRHWKLLLLVLLLLGRQCPLLLLTPARCRHLMLLLLPIATPTTDAVQAAAVSYRCRRRVCYAWLHPI